jgi:hypothetical protein
MPMLKLCRVEPKDEFDPIPFPSPSRRGVSPRLRLVDDDFINPDELTDPIACVNAALAQVESDLGRLRELNERPYRYMFGRMDDGPKAA